MSRICSKFETKKSFTYIPHRIGTFFHLKFVLNRSSAKVQKESTKKQPCSLEAQLGSSLRRLLLQSASHAAFVVVPWALGLGQIEGRPLSEDVRQDGYDDCDGDYGNDVNQKQRS